MSDEGNRETEKHKCSGYLMNIAVFASGRGTNLAAIIRAVNRGRLPVNIGLFVSDRLKAKAVAKAKRAGIKILVVEPKDFADKVSFEWEIIKDLKQNNIDLVVLAGFMRILSPEFVQEFKHRIINVHPALLPSFKGMQGIKDTFDYGVKVTGVTVHFVDEQMDHGPIILQSPVKIEESDTLDILEKKIHKIEHKIYPEAIRLIAEGRVRIEGRKVRIT